MSRPTVRLERHQRVAQLGVGAGGDPHLQRGDEERAGERGGEQVDHPVEPAAGRRGSAAASARISAPRRSARCSTAAITSAALVG